MVPELYAKMFEKRHKTGFRRNAIIMKSMNNFGYRTNTTILKPLTKV